MKWQFRTGATFTDYPPDINYQIEIAHLNKLKFAEWKEDLGPIKLLFSINKERQNDDPATDVEVRRKLLGSSSGI